jgi:hypothetical protein
VGPAATLRPHRPQRRTTLAEALAMYNCAVEHLRIDELPRRGSTHRSERR